MANVFSQIGYEPVVVNESSDIEVRAHHETLESMAFDNDIIYEEAMMILEGIASDLSDIKITKDTNPDEIESKIKSSMDAAVAGMKSAETVTKRINILSKVLLAATSIHVSINMICFAGIGNMIGMYASYVAAIVAAIGIGKGANVLASKKVVSSGESDDAYVVAVESYAVLGKLLNDVESSKMSNSDKAKATSSIKSAQAKIKNEIEDSRERRSDFKKSKSLFGDTPAGTNSTIKSVDAVNKRIKTMSKRYGVDLKCFLVK